MKRLLITVLLATITAGLGYYGIHDWDGESGGHWVVIFGMTFIIPILWTGSVILAGLIHLAFCVAVVWGISGIYRRIRSLATNTVDAESDQSDGMTHLWS